MDKFDYIDSIILALRGTTGINYQSCVGEVLGRYYNSIGKTYEMPDYYGGDQKNDGWVVEDALFYQIFAPTRLKESLRKEIQTKFEDDLKALFKIVYEDAKWNGKVKNFIFIVNTMDNNLPHDSERFFEGVANVLALKYSVDFKYSVVNTDYIRGILEAIDDIEILKSISSALRVKQLIDYNAITEKTIIDLIGDIAGNIHTKFLKPISTSSYERVSSTKKIDINGLEERRAIIEEGILHLDVVESAVNTINQDILYENKFERVKSHIIDRYKELSIDLDGPELYDSIIEDILKYASHRNAVEFPARLLVIYVFDKCDIFKKE